MTPRLPSAALLTRAGTLTRSRSDQQVTLASYRNQSTMPVTLLGRTPELTRSALRSPQRQPPPTFGFWNIMEWNRSIRLTLLLLAAAAAVQVAVALRAPPRRR